MFPVTRRGFLSRASAACAAAALSPLPFRPPGFEPKPSPDLTRILAVFYGIAPSRDDSDVAPLTNGEIVRRLERECRGVELVLRDLNEKEQLGGVLREIKDAAKLGYDGVMVYGWPRDYDFLRTGLPTVNVAVLNDFQNTPYPIFDENRVVGAFLDPWRFCSDPAVSEQMFRDLADKIRLIRALKRLKSEHILTVTDSPYVNVFYGDVLKNPPRDYNDQFAGAIATTFGTRVTKIGAKEVVAEPAIRDLWNGDSREANEIAKRWIGAAEKMTYTTESEVLRSAKLYLAMRFLMQKYEATAIAFHIRALVSNPRPEDYVFPALGTSEFQLHNQVGKCQSHLNIVLSEMLLQYAYQRPSMLGDYSVDPYNNTSCVQHCEGPWNPWGDERRVPYVLTDHRERRVRARRAPGGGAASWVLYPAGEPVTIWQVEVLNKELLLHTGVTVPMLDGPVKYKDHFWKMM